MACNVVNPNINNNNTRFIKQHDTSNNFTVHDNDDNQDLPAMMMPRDDNNNNAAVPPPVVVTKTFPTETTTTYAGPADKQQHNSVVLASFDDVFTYIKPWGLWQAIICLTLAFGGLLSCEHVVMHAFIGKTYSHHCALSAQDRTALPANTTIAWTEENFRDFYIPSKPRNDPPQIGETCLPCQRYMFNDLSIFDAARSFADAIKLRDQYLKANKSTSDIQITRCNHGYYYDTNASEFGGGVQQEFGLVCERDYLLPIGGTINILGVLFGAFLSGPISDRFGRRRAVVYFAIGMFFVSVLNAFSPIYTIFLILRFLTGLCEAGAYTASFVLVMECVGAKYRGPLGFAFCIPWGLGFVLLAFCAWLFPEWRRLQLAVALPSGILVALYIFIVPESPRWLLLHGRCAEAAKYLQQAYMRNNRRQLRVNAKTTNELSNVDVVFCDVEQLERLLHQTICSNRGSDAANPPAPVIERQLRVILDDQSTVRTAVVPRSSSTKATWRHVVAKHVKALMRSYADLFSSKIMVKITICMWLVWIANGIVYYGFSLSATDLKGFSMFINFALSGVVEVPAYLLAMLITARTNIGRRYLLFGCMLFCGLVLCGIFAMQNIENSLTPKNENVKENLQSSGALHRIQIAIGAMSHVGKFFITASFQMVWIFTSELYPTEIRNIGVGTSSTICRVFTSLTPMFIHLASTVWNALPTMIFAACSLVGAILCLIPPEMADAALSDQVKSRSASPPPPRKNSVEMDKIDDDGDDEHIAMKYAKPS